MRAAYARAVDQPGTTAVRDTAGNPPFAAPLTAAGSIPLAGAIDTTRPAGLAPATVDPRFRNASLQSWNVNLQRQLGRELAATVGYSGSHGTDLRISRNINQPVDGVRPFPAVAASSPILPGTPLGNITQVESSGFSNYHAAWVIVTKRLSRGLQFDTSYTWSKSRDTNSLNSSGFAVQDSYDIPSQYGPSDFDARHRFVLGAIYALPFTAHVLTRGWQVPLSSSRRAAILSTSSPATAASTAYRTPSVPTSPGPSVSSARSTSGSIRRCSCAVNRFGNLERNAVIGPAFHNTDLSADQERQTGRAGWPAVPRRRVRCLQPSQLRSAWQHRR